MLSNPLVRVLMLTLVTFAGLHAATAFEEVQREIPVGPIIEGDPGWMLLETIAIEEVQEDGEWRADKTFPADLRAATDSFEVRGYLIPIVPQGYFSQLLLVRDPDD
ncbi:MAG: hypothetical protein AAF813_12820, partial [Pseudomonadota bacterium]